MNPVAHPVRWGILSTAGIGRKVWQAIRLSGNGVVAAVASRDVRSAERFVRENQSAAPFAETPRALGSYEALLADPAIEAVYVPLPTGIRAPWVIQAAEAGKAVLCEKPCAASLGELRAMLDACAKAGVQFMDGVMFMHGARLPRILEAVKDAAGFGELRHVSSSFAFLGTPEFFRSNIRLDSTLEPYGCLGDLGWYCLRFALCIAEGRMPRSVSGRMHASGGRAGSAGTVPLRFSGELEYGTWSAQFFCAFDTGIHQWAHIQGTLGGIRLDDFVLPSGSGAAFWRAAQPVPADEAPDPHPEGQATRLYRAFADRVRAGEPDPRWPEITWKTQVLLDAAFRSASAGHPVEL